MLYEVFLDTNSSLLCKMAGVTYETDPPKGVTSLTLAEDDIKPANTTKRQIRYFDEDEIQQSGSSFPNNGVKLKKRSSAYSIHSLSSIKSGQRVVDPAVVLPVLYRTMSIDMARAQATKGVTTEKKDPNSKTMAGESVSVV